MRLLYGLFITLLMQITIFASTTIQNSYSYEELNKLTASDAAGGDNFGTSVSISGDYAIVGAQGNDDNGTASGSAYIFKNDGNGTFTQSCKLTASDANTSDWFGQSVAISGDYAIVGAYGNDDNGSLSGSAYIFKNDGSGNFTQSSKLIASDGAADHNFGRSVAISGDYAIVGAHQDDDNGSESGSAYIFKNDGSGNFTQSSKLIASDANASDYFGYSVAISGDYAIVGAHQDDDNGSESGSAYIFKDDGSGTFTQSSKLIASDANASDYFGYSVAISGDYAIVGAYADDDNGSTSGSAYIFKNDGSDTFTQSSKLRASDANESDYFGLSVAISGDYAIVGAHLDDDGSSGSGSAYVFKNDGSGSFTQNSKFTASDANASDYFGKSVAISGDNVIVGAYLDDDNGSSSGSAYIFNGAIKTDTAENSTTFSLDIDAIETLDYAISGTDSTLFDVNATTGEITFKAAPDYETPADADANNEYLLSVTANGAVNSDTKSVKITVIDAPAAIQNSYSYNELQKLTDSDPTYSDYYGYSVAVSGDYAVVGVYMDDDTATDSGSVYIFKNDGSGNFTQSDKLTASDPAFDDNFGYSVAISGDYVIVGACRDDDYGSESGSAYIFKNDGSGTFAQSSKLTASDAASSDEFGYSVAISGEYAIVGAYRNNDAGGSDSGSAYIFKNDGNGTFIESSKLIASDAAADDQFGSSVGISGDYAVVGARYDDDNGANSGSAYIFKNDGSGSFTQSSKLTASDGAFYDKFGSSVAISGDYAIVGAFYKEYGNYSGSAYIFKNDGNGIFAESCKLTASDAAASDNFGISVAISGDYAMVGAYRDSDGGSFSGSAYIFKNDGSGNFTQSSKLTASDPAAYDNFGISVAISGDYAMVGAYQDDDGATDSGSAYIFNGAIQSDTVENSTTFSLDIDAVEATGYGISGTDSALFDINTSTGEITFKAAPDYETPADADSDNVYELSVTANAAISSDTKSVKITVTDAPATIQNSYSYDELYRLTASDASASDVFGTSVAISGDYAIIGALGDDDSGSSSGSAYIFKNDGTGIFTQMSKLIASDGAADDWFGFSVAISGDYAIVGAYQDDDSGSSSGSAYIFKNDGTGIFTQTSKLIASDGAAGDWFGFSVAISGDYAIIGAYRNADAGTDSGSAYIFKNNGTGIFTQSSKLTASDAVADDRFGSGVAISGDYAIIGANGDDSTAYDTGSAYIFKNDGSGSFTQSSKLTASDGALYDNFGISVAISGDYAIVGAFGDGGDYSGSAYIFKHSGSGTFTQSCKVRASNPVAGDQFGRSVAISDDHAIVGAHYADDNGSNSGSAYIFMNDGTGTFKLIASDAAAGDFFGKSVAISGDYAMVGASGDDIVAYDSEGSVYTFNGAIQSNTSENNTSFSLDINATEATNYGISGTDSALFDIDAATGEITFKAAPDYENPLDADSDNVYLLSVTANATGGSDTKTVKIEVTNVDDDAPTGYSVEFDLSDINASQTDSTSFIFTNAEVGSTYDYSVSSSRGGGSVTGSGTITAADQTILIDDLSGLFDGTLTISVTLTNSANNTGDTVTHTTILNAVTEGIAVTVIDDTTSEASSDNSALFSVTLMSEPEHEVTITLASTNTAEGNVTIPVAKLLYFISGNWNIEQNVTVVGVDDSQKDGDIAYFIDLNASSSDSEYDGKNTQVNLINSDDDEGGMIPAIIMYLLD